MSLPCGDILINGYSIQKQPRKAKAEIGYMPENVPLYSDLTVKEFVSYMADLKLVPKKNRKSNVDKVLKDTLLEGVQNKLIRNLSRGYKQRVGLAGALVNNPKILILDEPTVGLDPKQITEIRTLIKSLGQNHTVILSSHILSEVSQICEKVIIMNEGKIVAIDSPKNLEDKTNKENLISITVEDTQNKIEEVIKNIDNVTKLQFVKDNEDGTKDYLISCSDDKDLRKKIFETFAKDNITIFEMKKSEITLEDAFMKLIDNNNEKGGME